jgi:hypothetical protein
LGLKSPSVTGDKSAVKAYSSSFLEALSRTLISMDSMQVANCMWALGKYGIRWDSLTVNVQKAYQQAIIRVAFKMNSMAVANTIHGLSHQRYIYIYIYIYMYIYTFIYIYIYIYIYIGLSGSCYRLDSETHCARHWRLELKV